MITCQECYVEFEVIHDSFSEPEFCPFRLVKLIYDDTNIEEDEDSLHI